MRLTNSIILALAVASFVIGVHQTFQHGFENTYFIFMITASLIILNRLFQPKDPEKQKEKEKAKEKKKKKKRKDALQGNRQMRRAMKK